MLRSLPKRVFAVWTRMALVLFCGCGPQIVALNLDASALDYGFLLLLHGTEAPSISAVFEPQGETLPAFRSVPEDTTAIVLGFTKEAIRADALDFIEQRAGELQLLPTSAPAQPLLDGRPAFVHIPLPELSLLAAFSETGAPQEEPLLSALPALSLIVPIEPERCRPERRPLEAFGLRANVLPNDTPVNSAEQHIFALASMNNDHVLALTTNRSYLISPDQALVTRPISLEQPGNVLLHQDPLATWDFLGLDVLSDGDHVWIAGEERATNRGILLQLRLNAGELSVTQTLTSTTRDAFSSMIRTEDGRLLIATTNGRFVRSLGDRFEPALPPLPLPEGAVRRPRNLKSTGDPRHPYLIVRTGYIYVFDAAETRWLQHRVPPSTDGSLRPMLATAVSRTEDGKTELWAGGDGPVLFRKRGEEPWMELPLSGLPPRLAGCASGRYPNLRLDTHFSSLLTKGEYLYITFEQCSAVIALRREDSCLSILTVGGGKAVFRSDDFQSLTLQGDQLIAGGESGLLFRASGR